MTRPEERRVGCPDQAEFYIRTRLFPFRHMANDVPHYRVPLILTCPGRPTRDNTLDAMRVGAWDVRGTPLDLGQ